MKLRGDERGQAVQVGAVLLLAVFVITLSLYQATVIPGENRQVEFNDYQDATGDVADLRNAILRSAGQDTRTGVTVRTGTQYPARTLFVNPPRATGRLTSSSAANVTVANVESAGDYENVGKYLESEGHALNVSTRRTVFDPAYNELDVAPVATAYGATYRTYDDPVLVTDQTLVDGNRITLVSVAGDLGAGGYTTPVTAEPVSAHTRTVSVTGDGGPLNLTVPTELSAAVWEDRLLAGQMAPDGHVVEVAPGPRPNTVNVSLEGGQTYELRLGRVEIREQSDAATEPTPEPRYLVSDAEQGEILEEASDGRVKLSAEARDRFNNPRSNANVTFNISVGRLETRDGTVLGTDNATLRTNENGKASVWYNASTAGVHRVEVFLGDAVDKTLPGEKKLQYKVVSTGQGGGGGGGGGGAGEAGVFILLEGTTATDSTDTVTFHLNSTSSTSLNLTGIQLAHITEVNGGSGQGSATFVDGANAITRINLTASDEPDQIKTGIDANEEFKPVFFDEPLTFHADSNTLTLTFDQAHTNHKDDQIIVRFHLFFEGGISASFDQTIFL